VDGESHDDSFGMMGFMEFRGRDGVRLAYRETGNGRPLILIHGYMGRGTVWIETGIAGRLADRGHRVIMPDMRGHGDSARPHDAAAYPPDVLADDGLALIEHLGLTDYDLGGYSLGGRTVVRLLARGATPRRAVVGGQGLEAILHTAGRGGQFRKVLSGFGTHQPGSPEQQTEDWIRADGGDPVALVRIIDTFVNTTSEELGAVGVPVLVLAGAEDGHNATAQALAEALPNGRYTELPGNHLTAMTSPEFEKALTSFLDQRD
jgi:pimeloyl-ACP methyl ester carboxylesterase